MAELAGYEIEFPFGPAAGAINGLNEEVMASQIKDCLDSPMSVAWLGSFTMNGGPGNDADGRVYYHNPRTGTSVNALGLPNIGAPRGAVFFGKQKRYADHLGKLLIPSVSPGKGEDPMEVLPVMCEMFVEAGADVIEANYSCHNKVTDDGGREPIVGHDLELMYAIDEAIGDRVGGAAYLIRKFPFYINKYGFTHADLLDPAAELLNRSRIPGAANLSNTIGGQQLVDEAGRPALDVPGNIGSMSGPFIAEDARAQLRAFDVHLCRHMGKISSGGIVDGQEVFMRTHELNADLTAGVTIFLENERKGISYGQTGWRIAEQYVEAQETAGI